MEIFHRHNPSGRTVAMGLTQPLTEMSTRNILWLGGRGGTGGRSVGLTTLPPSCADCLEIYEPQPPGTLRTCPGLQWDWFNFIGKNSLEAKEDKNVKAGIYVSFLLYQQRRYSNV